MDETSVCAKIAQTATDGKVYNVNMYNLDVILAVGYRINCAGDHCFGDINLTPIEIINSSETKVQSSSSCSILNGTIQYVEILSDGIENGQKVQAEIDYGKKIKSQNVYYLYKLINVTVINDK